MMLGLLIYSYSTGTFASHRIETLTYENVAVRFLTADTHPDHDSICKFLRENRISKLREATQAMEQRAKLHLKQEQAA